MFCLLVFRIAHRVLDKAQLAVVLHTVHWCRKLRCCRSVVVGPSPRGADYLAIEYERDGTPIKAIMHDMLLGKAVKWCAELQGYNKDHLRFRPPEDGLHVYHSSCGAKQHLCPSRTRYWFRQFLVIYRCLDKV